MDLETRLQKLKDLRDKKLIEEEEYRERRRLILDKFSGSDVAGDPLVGFRPKPVTELEELSPGQEIGPADRRFRLERRIGRGGMGEVWRARDLAAEELEGGECYKALKMASPQLVDSKRHLELLKKEALRASRLSHPNIVNVNDWREDTKLRLPFVVMDYLKGHDLNEVLGQEGNLGGLGWERMLELLRPMVAGLAYAHNKGLIHRDLKPGNVFVTARRREVKLLDFGLSYRLRRSNSVISAGEEVSGGTAVYMPPEGFFGGMEPDVRYDVYALACLVYEMLTGKPPYIEELARSRPEGVYPPCPRGISEAVWAVLKAGLAYRREARPGGVVEFMETLESARSVESKPLAAPELITMPEPVSDEKEEVAWKPGYVFSDMLSDGGEGPKMVVIPAGTFQMGDSQGIGNDDEQPVHEVRITKDFAIGVYEVTFDEYDRFAQTTGRRKPEDKGWGRVRRPVIDVSWEDAVAYAKWLSEQTSEEYRLPTEAQWEYAARAGSQAAYSFGNDESRLGDYAWYGENSDGKTHPVGRKKPNGWGLYDVHGNVYEWVQDWYGEYSSDPVEDPQGPAAGSLRLNRGGSWFYDSGNCRSALRVFDKPDLRVFNLGFRLSRLL